jgi:hypothetical protein
VNDTGDDLSIPIPVTVAAPSASSTQTTAGTRSLRVQLQTLINNIAQLFASYVPSSRTVNNRALTGNISITAEDVGLGNVNNTSDADKPVSTATQNALNYKANKTQAYGKKIG